MPLLKNSKFLNIFAGISNNEIKRTRLIGVAILLIIKIYLSGKA